MSYLDLSHETLYRYIWADKKKGGTLYRYLRRGRKKYGKRGAGRHPNRCIQGRISIDERPAIVREQGRLGDWEADTVYGRQRKSCLVTAVERKSLYLRAAFITHATAARVNRGLLESLEGIPQDLIHTLTIDNGKEWVKFKALESQLNAAVYFTHPYSAWERPINENTNGLLRQFLQKQMDLWRTTPQQLDEIVQRLNDRPRKKLEYRTPNEVFSEAMLHLKVESAWKLSRI